MKRGYKYRFYPTDEQADVLSRTFGCVRKVWNETLAYRTNAWFDRQERVNYNDSSTFLTQLKQQDEFSYLNEVSSVPLQQTLRNQQTGFSRFFKQQAGYPAFKAKHRSRDSAEYTRSAFKFNAVSQELRLAKMDEPLDIRWSRVLPAEPSTITVSRDSAHRWYVVFLVDDPNLPMQLPVAPNQRVGIDLGVSALAVLSSGEKITNPRHFDQDHARLRKAQRELARKQKGSANREKARRKVARAHARIADRRRDHLHKLTTRLVRENQTIVIEDLSVRNMVANRCLSRVISDAGWAELRRQLEYKAEWYGREVLVIDRFFPSTKRCSDCGYINQNLTLNDRTWTCPACGVIHDRDVNAAINISAAGHAVHACGGGVRPDRHSVEKATADEAGISDE